MAARKFFYAYYTSLLLPCQLFAWVRVGHQIVAQRAMYQLSDATAEGFTGAGRYVSGASRDLDAYVRNELAYKYTESHTSGAMVSK